MSKFPDFSSVFDFSFSKGLRGLDDFWKRMDGWEVSTGVKRSLTSGNCEYVENGDELTIYALAPGYGRDDLTVEVQDGVLRVSGKLADDQRKSSFVPDSVDYEFSVGAAYQIEEASHENGLLAIRLTRLQKTSEATKIPLLARVR